MSDLPPPRTSIIRISVAALCGAVISWCARHSILIPEEVSGWVADAMTAVAVAGWYAVARWCETRSGSSWAAAIARSAGRWMLGGRSLQ